ncbi:MAG: phospho-sugar mutase [Lachnospiraceae bacterium]|nr:phospho-sugar mutase [Lachnospiraceae bacterium]
MEKAYMEKYNQWLMDPFIDDETKTELKSISGNEAEIEDRFYKELEFGTAGLRGIMGAGTNRMNKYIVAKATQGLADYINAFFEILMKHREEKEEELCEASGHDCSKCGGCSEEMVPGVAIAYDSRHHSEEFSEIAASVLNANGIRTYVFENLRPTPELSFTIRHLGCVAGINITSSHNPAEYNGYKVYWADGAQITAPHDENITACIRNVQNFSNPKRMEKKEAISKELYVSIGRITDEAYMNKVSEQVKEPSLMKQMARDITVAYTPLHGAGITIIPELLHRFGIDNLYIVKEQEKPDGDFPTVEFPNPEMPTAFQLVDELGQKVKADLMIATDPDSDRIGVHVRDEEGKYHELSGNVLGCLVCEYELERLKAQGKIPADGYVIRSIVSSRLFDRIAKAHGVEVREVLTGFKNIGAEMFKSEVTKDGTCILAYEESYGYLVGDYARDKDACVTALILCEMCAYYKYEDMTLWDAVCEMYEKYGYEEEKTVSITRKGINGLEEISNIMTEMRKNPPAVIGGYEVKRMVDYEQSELTGLPKSNVLFFQLEGGWVCVRPSGTEPKIKYYFGVTEELSKATDKIQLLEEDFVK